MQSTERYDRIAILLHWGVALLVLAMIGLGFFMVDIPRGTPDRGYFYNLHKSIGLTIAALVLIRLWWRIRHPPPALPSSMPGWQVKASKTSHALLYILLIAMPVIGFAASQFTQYGVTYFGILKIPALGSENKAIYETLQSGHKTMAVMLTALVAVHILAALYHRLISKDGILDRMLPWR